MLTKEEILKQLPTGTDGLDAIDQMANACLSGATSLFCDIEELKKSEPYGKLFASVKERDYKALQLACQYLRLRQ